MGQFWKKIHTIINYNPKASKNIINILKRKNVFNTEADKGNFILISGKEDYSQKQKNY